MRHLIPADGATESRALLVLIGLVLAAACLVIGVWVQSGALPGERWLAQQLYVAWEAHAPLQAISGFMGALARGVVALITVLIGVAILWRNVGRCSAAGIVFASAAVLVAEAAKSIVGPTPAEIARLGQDALANFPSGHVVYATAVFGYLAVVGWRTGRREVTAIMILLIVLMGPSMLMLSVHQPSDVLAGYCLGGAWLCLTLLVIQAFDRNFPQERAQL